MIPSKINSTNYGNKPIYRFRQNLITGTVECITAQWPVKTPSNTLTQTGGTSKVFDYRTVSFPNKPGLCPKCLGRGVVIGQISNRVMGVCFWCDGKGSISDADIANAERRTRMGLSLDCRQSR